MFKFLHVGDVHLDTSFLCRSATLREQLREALRTSFERAVDCAIAEEVDALLIAGDLFDSDRLSYRTEAFLVDQFRRLDQRGIATIYATGNHDPGGGPFGKAAREWPDRCTYVAANEPVIVDVAGRNGEIVARVVTAGHATAAEATNLARLFPQAADRVPHVGLLHTMVTGARDLESHSRYAPCAVEDLRRTGFRYWALGHIHVRQQVCDQSNAYYCGNLQGRHPKESGPKGGLLVQLRDGLDPEVDFRSFAPIQWLDLRIGDLDGHTSLHALTEAIRSSWSEHLGQNGEAEHILRLTLAGPTPMYHRLLDAPDLQELEETLAEALGVLDVEVRTDGLSMPVDLEEHRGQPHLLGEVLAMLEEFEKDPALLERLAPDALAGFSERDAEGRRAYVRSLLPGLDREAAMRLLKAEV